MARVDIRFPGNIAQVGDYSDLRNIPSYMVDTGTLYVVLSAGKSYAYDPGSTASDDGSNVIKPNDKTTLQAGRWLFQAEGFGTGPAGPAGPSNNTRKSLTELKNAAITDVSSIYDGSLWFWTPGDFTGQANDATIVQSNIAAISVGAWVRPGVVLTPEMFGAIGNGIFNDTDAFVAMNNVITALGGGAIVLKNTTYLVGKQEFAGATGKGYSYRGKNIFFYQNLTKPVIIQGNGAKFNYAAGLKFGGFNPVTGAKLVSATTVQDNYAHIGYFCFAFNCSYLYVENVEVFGNQANADLGGPVGDTGYQAGHYGFFPATTPATLVNCKATNMCLDGFAVDHKSSTTGSTPLPVTMINCVSDMNCRQGLSWVGGLGLTAINCVFSNTGKGAFQSLPTAGMDIEPESATVRNGRFINCQFLNNGGAQALIVPTGPSTTAADITFENCVFRGSTGYSVWPNAPRVHFKSCRLSGQALGNHIPANRQDATIFEDCQFDTVRYNNLAPFGSGLMDIQGYTILKNCGFITTDTAVGLGSSLGNTVFENCNFTQNGFTSVSNVRGTFMGVNTFAITTGSVDFGGATSSNFGRLNYTGTATNIAGVGGEVGNISPPVFRGYRIGLKAGNYVKFQDTTWDSGTGPAAAFGVPFDIVYNSNPTVGSASYWLRLANDSMVPGGIVGASRAAAQTDSVAADVTALKTDFNALLAKLRAANLIA